jgi:uracil-DNA glycosylase family 4
MTLELDTRQRAMLMEMGVHVWLPEPEGALTAAQEAPAPDEPAARAAEPRAPVQMAAPAAPTPRAEPVPAATARTPAPMSPPRAAAAPSAATVAADGEPLDLGGMDGAALAEAAAACQACGLCAGRKQATLQAVPSPYQADWLVLGDPPDEDEDRLGQPFAEQTGILLDNMLKAVGAARAGTGAQGAYLSNVVKCRPPLGRVPQAAELAQCAQYLQREIALVQPKIILAMGRFAAQTVLSEHPEQAALPLGKQRGQVYRYQGIPVVVTYHPKVLLRASADKAKAWADMCLALDVLDGA